MAPVRIGVGAGFSGDRLDAALPLVERGEIGYLVFECLAERTIALAQRDKLRDPTRGYHPLLDERVRRVLPACVERGVKIVGNLGAANPVAAGARVSQLARKLGIGQLRVAVVLGDDVLELVRDGDFRASETGERLDALPRIVSANAYLGAEPIRDALADGADVVITGRVADPSLILGPLAYEFGWAADDWQRLGAGTVVGHLLECTTQVTGGYFADPGYKDVPDLANVGYPIGEVQPSGEALITKTPGSGGLVSTATCKEQLLYEVHDPARYLTPDVTADFTGVEFEAAGPDRVRVSGAGGSPRPELLKVSIGCLEGFVAEDMFCYAGPGALERARLAERILRARLAEAEADADELRIDFVGLNAVHGEATPEPAAPPYEVAVRVAARARCRAEVEKVVREVDAIAVGGPAATGKRIPFGARVREVVGVRSGLIPRQAVPTRIIL
jgi:Acyclic terpene utilisation family protein AtuA